VPFAEPDLRETLRNKAAARRRRAAELADAEASKLLAQAEELEALARALDLQERALPTPALGPVRWGTPWRLSK